MFSYSTDMDQSEMCRWIAYRGEPVLMETLVSDPGHSLIAQSLKASESVITTNGDGKMPPLGRNVTDPDAVRLIEEWIRTLPPTKNSPPK